MKRFRFSFHLIVILSFMNACYYVESADLIIHNAKIYTVDNDFSIVEAMAIKDGKIIDFGPNNEIKNRYDADRIDAKNRPIFPGFIDSHCHFLWYGNSFFEVDLYGSKSWEEVLKRTVEFSKSNHDEWIIGNGWDQNEWENKAFPTKQKLDSLFPDRAVILKRVDQHAAIANQKALDLAKIDQHKSVEGGVFEKSNGRLTGILIDHAISEVSKAIPPMTDKRMEEALLKAQEMCFSKGLTTVNDAMLENEMVNAIDKLHQAKKLKMKVYGMLIPSEENKKQFLTNGPYITKKLSIRSFKYFADGALGSRGAKLIEPYLDDSTNSGLFLRDSSYLLSEAKLLFENGFQMNTHCIGDHANRMLLDIYGEVLQSTNDKRWRIEHAQVVHPNDLSKFKQFTIIPSVQPTHAISDKGWVEERLGESRSKTAYCYKDLMEQNGLLALGTDFPIEDIDPLKTFYAATIRKDYQGEDEQGFQMENAIDRVNTLKGMTIWGAIANFEEEVKGSLEKGKSADFIILDQDIMEIEPDKILRTKVLETYSEGELVFKTATN